MRTLLVVVAVVALVCSTAAGQQPAADLSSLLKRATDAYAAKDYAGFRDATLAAQALAPESSRLWYNSACALALTGDAARAAAFLDRISSAGLYVPAAKDDDFAAIRDTDAFRGAVARLEKNLTPVSHATVAFTLPERGLVAEGIAYDAKTKSFFVSSVHKKKIYRVDVSGRASEFLANRDELWGAFGIAVDAKRRRLWVTTAVVPQMLGFSPENDGRSGLLRYDVDTGKLTGTYVLSNAPAHHAVTDLTVAANGDVYAADGQADTIYRLKDNATALEPLALGVELASPQGLAFAADGRRLYVADYLLGIFAVDVATLATTKLTHADGVFLLGVDGLAFANGALYATQNGISPKRVVRISLDAAGTKAERLDVLAANAPGLGEPTLGTVADGAYYFNADAQWDAFDAKNALPPDAEMRAHTVMRAKL